MRTAVVVKAYLIAEDAAGVLDGFEAMPMRALQLERADHAFDLAVLLGIMRRDELLAQP